jgi:hypothetical protein
MIEVPQPEITAMVVDLKLASVEGNAVLIAENRQEHFAAQFAFHWFPIDIEIVGERGRRPVFGNVPPPEVLGLIN